MQKVITYTLKTDANQAQQSLEGMTLDGYEAFVQASMGFLEIAKALQAKGIEVEVKIIEGSASEELLVAEEDADLAQSLVEEVFNDQSQEEGIVRGLELFRQLVHKNGRDQYIHGQGVLLNQDFKDRTRPFRRKRSKSDIEVEVLFLRGKLYQLGGKTTDNLHLETEDGDYVLNCTEQEVLDASPYNKRQVVVSALKHSAGPFKRASYTLCTLFKNELEMQAVKELYEGFLMAQDQCQEGSFKEVIVYNFNTLQPLFAPEKHILLMGYVRLFLSDKYRYIVLKSVYTDFSQYAHYTQDRGLVDLSDLLGKYYRRRKNMPVGIR